MQHTKIWNRAKYSRGAKYGDMPPLEVTTALDLIAAWGCSTWMPILYNFFSLSGKSCGDPGTPRNGKKLGLSYILNDVVRYSCDDCYKLSGVSYRQCLADGTWSDRLPTCTRTYYFIGQICMSIWSNALYIMQVLLGNLRLATKSSTTTR